MYNVPQNAQKTHSFFVKDGLGPEKVTPYAGPHEWDEKEIH